jgi:hypothetical protein
MHVGSRFVTRQGAATPIARLFAGFLYVLGDADDTVK